MKKISELLRLACLYAEQNREGFIAAHEGMEDDPACVEAKTFLAQLRAYRMKRWGRTKIEKACSEAKAQRVTS